MGLMKKLTSSIVASSLVLGLVGTAFAAPTADATNNAFERLSHYNIAKGKVLLDGTIDPALNDSITRAELVTVITRAFGQEETAKILAGAASFNDVATNEWYSGYVALAKNMAEKQGFPIGYEDGTFQPNKQVSAVEALAFIMKYLGVKPATGANWAADTVKAATEAGVITTADAEAYLADLNAPATRGLAFGLADTIFGSYNKLAGGKTVYTAFVDTQAPVVTLDKVEATTAATTKISGKVSGDYTEVYIGTEKITVNEDGTFTAEVKLTVGENAISVIAKDLAGNEGVGTTTVTRTVGAAAAIEATLGASEIVAGGQTDLTIKVVDANGGEVTVPAADIKVTSTLGTYAEGKFTAGTKAGAGTITVSYGDFTKAVDLKVLAGEMAKVEPETTSVAPGKAVKLIAKDANGNAIEGATFTEDSTDAFIDGDLFTATKAGQYTVKAMKGEKIVEGVVGVYGTVTDLKVETAKSIVANGKSELTVTVYAVDEAGNVNLGYDKAVTVATVLDPKDGNPSKFKAGKATFVFTADAGLADSEVDITATSEKLDETISVEVAAQVATSIKVEAPEYLPTNSIVGRDVEVTVLDQEGKAMVDGAWEFDVTVTGAASLSKDEDLKKDTISLGTADAAKTFQVFPTEKLDTGAITVAVSYPGLATASASMKAAYAQDAKSIRISTKETETTVEGVDKLIAAEPSDNYIEYSVELLDKNGVPTNETKDVKVVFDGLTDSAKEIAYFSHLKALEAPATERAWSTWEALRTGTTNLSTTIQVEDGVGTFRVAGTKAGTFSLKVEDPATSSKLSTSASSSITLKPAAPKYVGFTSEKLNLLADASTATLTAQLYDEFGNKAAKSGVNVTFQDTADKYDGLKLNGKAEAAKDVVTDETGKASVEMALESYLNDANITLVSGTDANLTVGFVADAAPAHKDATFAAVAVALVKTAPTKVTTEVVADADKDVTATTDDQTRMWTLTAGRDDLYVKVTIKDNYDRPVTDLTNYDVKVTASSSKVTVDAVNEAHKADGVYYFPVTGVEKAGTLTFTVEVLNVANELKVDKAVSVTAGAPEGVILAEADSDNKVTFKEGKETTYTIKLVDKFFNEVSGSKNTSDVVVALGAPTGSEFRDADGQTITEIKVPKGRNSVTVKFITDNESAKVTLTVGSNVYTIN